MILYFDSFITDKSLYGQGKKILEIRKSKTNYSTQPKLDIAKYTLGTYAQHKWTDVLIRYELDKDYDKLNHKFEEYVRDLFPSATVINKRSESIKDFRVSWEFISKYKSDWIFLSSNNDHPWLWYDAEYINKILATATKFLDDRNFISIVYSHYSEFYNFLNYNSPFYKSFGNKAKIVYEDDECFVMPRVFGDYSSVQILHKKLFKYWLVDTETNNRVIRTESVANLKKTKNHLMVIPKKELCVHFDGYNHTEGTPYYIAANSVPPLFIPPGYFDKKIKLSISKKKSDTISIGLYKDHYSFEKDSGCDIKLSLQGLPTAWNNRIVFKDFDENNFSELALKAESFIRKNPYKINNINYILMVFVIKMKTFFFRSLILKKIKNFFFNKI